MRLAIEQRALICNINSKARLHSRLGLSSLRLSLLPFRLEESSLNDKPTWTLLLTDPNRMARTTLTRQLTYYGYAVEADSGRQAVGIFQKQPSAIDLILLDTSIADVPYTNVIQVQKGEVHPSAAIILTTEQTITDGRSLPKGVTAVLKKPMRTDRMLSVVAKALGRT